jgi:hypothetical protein
MGQDPIDIERHAYAWLQSCKYEATYTITRWSRIAYRKYKPCGFALFEGMKYDNDMLLLESLIVRKYFTVLFLWGDICEIASRPYIWTRVSDTS